MMLDNEIVLAQRNVDEKEHKLHEVEVKCSQVQQNMQSLEEKLLNLEDENRVLRQKALSISPGTKQATLGVAKSFLEGYLEKHELPMVDRKELFESPTPSRIIRRTPLAQTDRWSKAGSERHQENQEFVLRCVREDLGYINGKPVAACSIFKCLLRWHAFEAERTVIFDRIIEAINDAVEVENEKKILPYWLSNASALLCLLQKNLRTNGFFATPQHRATGSMGLIGRMTQSFKSPSTANPLLRNGTRDGALHVEARYPAILFKQQLTACLEKIFGLVRDNVKKDIQPMLSLCIQAPKTAKVPPGKTSRSSLGSAQQSLSSHWENIIKFLDSLMDSLQENYVPPFLIRKLITRVFSFINIQLFNSLLLRRECCTFSNGEYVKSGLVELERWIFDVTEYAGTSWHELKYIRQAVGFLVIHQKRRKTLGEIRQDLCPALTIQQLYRICTLYWDDKYGTQSVSNEVVAQMKEIVSSKDSSNFITNSFLLDDDLSIPFSAEDLSQAIPSVDPEDVEMPSFFHEMPSLHLLLQH